MIRVTEKAADDGTPILSWRRLCALYAVLVAIGFGYIAEPGGPAWLAGTELLWIALDLALVTAMVRGSVNALILLGGLDLAALISLTYADSLEPQAGFPVMVSLLVARLAVLVLAWRERPPDVRRPR